MAMHLKPSSRTSPDKRIKIPTSTPGPTLQSPPPFISKGKSKVQEGTSPPIQMEIKIQPTDCCGICLSEAGNGEVSRGYIDSCNHYYCFVCIMEWAKVESKCPLCKRRFSTIRRPPKPPIFTAERVVHVPIRDQVYHYSGNATIGPADPYSEVKCGVCHGIADESLLLLCDLCDSAAHTYCVGLGLTVPEGDWFCQDCTLLKSESNTYSGIQMSFGPVQKISTKEHVSDFVQQSCSDALQRSRYTSSDPCCLPPRTSIGDENITSSSLNQSSSTSLEIIAKSSSTKPNARTLWRCRNLHDRILVLRENWHGFQSGILHFSSRPGDGNISSQKSMTHTTGQDSIFFLNEPSIARCCSSAITNDIVAYETKKAWKMMDKAKSIQQDHERSGIVRQALNCPEKNTDYRSHRHLSPDSQQNGAKSVGSVGQKHSHYCSPVKDCYRRPSSVSGKRKLKMHVAKDVTYCCESSITGHSPKHRKLESSKGISPPSYVGCQKLPVEEASGGPHHLSPSDDASGLIALNIDQVKGFNHASSSHIKVRDPKEKSESEKMNNDNKQYSDAKSEIQSLVKLNLKIQAKKEKLEVDAFKEVARVATHSILAACGFEHPRPGSPSIPGVTCAHRDDTRQLQKSSLMPHCCRECFYVFVKDVVDSINMLQKKRQQKTHDVSVTTDNSLGD